MKQEGTPGGKDTLNMTGCESYKMLIKQKYGKSSLLSNRDIKNLYRCNFIK